MQPFLMQFEILAQYASAIGLGLTAVLFAITYWRQRQLDQMKMAHDVQQRLTTAENNLLAEMKREGFSEDQKRYRNIQYLNVWEWFSFQVTMERLRLKRYTISSDLLSLEIEKRY